MTREEQAIVYFKDMRKRMCEDHLKICPKDSVAYRATLIEKGFYDAAIKALEQEIVHNLCDSCTNIGCEFQDGKSDVLDKIRAEIEEAALDDVNGSKFIFVNRVNQIIDKYKTESEGAE